MNGCTPYEFSYSAAESVKSEFYFFRMNHSDEDTFLIRCCDNSWIMIDGGITDWAYFDGTLADDIYNFMRERYENIKTGNCNVDAYIRKLIEQYVTEKPRQAEYVDFVKAFMKNNVLD